MTWTARIRWIAWTIALHLALVVLANYLAFWLRFDGAIPEPQRSLWPQMLPWLLAIRGLTFVPFGLYQSIWRYTGIWDLRNIILGVAASSGLFYVFTHLAFGYTAYPRSVFVIDGVLLIFFVGGVRLSRRISRELRRVGRERTVLVFGAGDAGEMIVRDMRNNPFYDCVPIGFIDDDPTKVGRRIHGVPVLGTRRDLPRVIATERPSEIVVAMPSADAGTVRSVVKVLEPYKVPIKTLPNLRDVLNGQVAVSQIRALSVEDLLARVPVGLDPERVRSLIAGKRVMVTGAGGSIGAELCRQIARFAPSSLVLFERYENGLYAIEKDLAALGLPFGRFPVIGDITDVPRVSAVMTEHRPQILFHAAAHKHVPLMESNPCEAVKNNVLGTRIVAEEARRHGVERFILISTDKAVNPSSVMGATKRVAELVVRSMAGGGPTRFVAVRFGNVLGSNGSVVPLFLEQIKAGGPVTVTHPEMRRYFMLIPEAVQLVLHAAAAGRGGSLYVLDMGEQIKVVEMARNLIRLSGFVPDEEIPITFIGLRPGEKLEEELVGADETVAPSGVAEIREVRPVRMPQPSDFESKVRELERMATAGDAVAVARLLGEAVPTFPGAGVAAGHARAALG